MDEEAKLEKLRKKPDKLRKQLFEVVLRKRIFLTNRMEKIEKMLVMFGIISEQQLANQQMELIDKDSEEMFKALIRSKMAEPGVRNYTGSSLTSQTTEEGS